MVAPLRVGVAGLGVGGLEIAGGAIPGGGIAVPGNPSSENDQPSTLPTGGFRDPPPSLVITHLPPRAAVQ